MVEITKRFQLEDWLVGGPREDAVLIAARAALRVFPLIAPVVERNAKGTRTAVVLPVCRAMAVASVAGTWPTLATEVRAAANAAANAAGRAADTPAARAAAANVAMAAANAANAAANAAVNAAVNAADRATDTLARMAAYSPIAADASDLEQGVNHAAVAAEPIWRGRPLRFLGIARIGSTSKPPDEIDRAWKRLKSHLERAGDDWHVWVDWYQDRLDGKPANMDLELAKALIPEETWKAGPAVVNAEIKRLIDKFDRDEADPEDNNDSARQIAEGLEKTRASSESDYRHDATNNRMLPEPFREDAITVVDPFRLREKSDLLEALAESAKNLHYDFKEDQPQVSAALRRDLLRYGKEASKLGEHVNPRFLNRLALKFEAALTDEETRVGLDNYEISGLEGLLIEHRALIAGYYAVVLERAAAIESYALPAGTDPEAVEQAEKDARDLLSGPEWALMPAPPEDYIENLDERLEEVRELRLKVDFAATEEIRQNGARQLHQDHLVIASDVARLLSRSAEAAVNHPVTQGAATIGSALGLVKMIIDLLKL